MPSRSRQPSGSELRGLHCRRPPTAIGHRPGAREPSARAASARGAKPRAPGAELPQVKARGGLTSRSSAVNRSSFIATTPCPSASSVLSVSSEQARAAASRGSWQHATGDDCSSVPEYVQGLLAPSLARRGPALPGGSGTAGAEASWPASARGVSRTASSAGSPNRGAADMLNTWPACRRRTTSRLGDDLGDRLREAWLDARLVRGGLHGTHSSE
mmetsp:Transcript_41919/g.125341  ORF Transcript_41919/g.125341 Transcript_41919/m.125341 type:complete len:215 (-) Transcript_41919:738-1382(-)